MENDSPKIHNGQIEIHWPHKHREWTKNATETWTSHKVFHDRPHMKSSIYPKRRWVTTIVRIQRQHTIRNDENDDVRHPPTTGIERWCIAFVLVSMVDLNSIGLEMFLRNVSKYFQVRSPVYLFHQLYRSVLWSGYKVVSLVRICIIWVSSFVGRWLIGRVSVSSRWSEHRSGIHHNVLWFRLFFQNKV